MLVCFGCPKHISNGIICVCFLIQELELIMPVLVDCTYQFPSLMACKEHQCQPVPLGNWHHSCPMLALFPSTVTMSKLSKHRWFILSKHQGKHWLLIYFCHLSESKVCLELSETVFPKKRPFSYQIGISYLCPLPREQPPPEVPLPLVREASGMFQIVKTFFLQAFIYLNNVMFMTTDTVKQYTYCCNLSHLNDCLTEMEYAENQ